MEVRLHALQGMLCMQYDIIRPHDSLRIQPFLLAPRFARGKPLGETSVVARSKEKRLNSQANNTKTIKAAVSKVSTLESVFETKMRCLLLQSQRESREDQLKQIVRFVEIP